MLGILVLQRLPLFILKKGNYKSEQPQEDSFELINHKLISASVLSLPDIKKVFEMESDTSVVAIGTVLSQDGKAIEFFNEKLNETRKRWSIYEHEFYAIIKALKHWEHYLIPKEFILQIIKHCSLLILKSILVKCIFDGNCFCEGSTMFLNINLRRKIL